MQLKPIDEWRKAHKFWSVRLNALLTAISTILLAWPDAALSLWGLLPAEVKALLPEKPILLVLVILSLGALAARFIKQEKVREE